jgi:hypothetical protein
MYVPLGNQRMKRKNWRANLKLKMKVGLRLLIVIIL